MTGAGAGAGPADGAASSAVVGARQLYDRVAQETASIVIRRYSTSFGLAARLLGAEIRQDVENVYALVRIADEIVDGVAAAAGLSAERVLTMLDALERDTEEAVESGYSSNLVVHAFAISARSAGIGSDLTRPFFASMRADLSRTVHTPETFQEYVYGSAEVVGLMCLRIFLRGHDVDDAQRAAFVVGARSLGAAFQKVNFLRDLSADHDELGRSYFPGVSVDELTEAQKRSLLDDIDADLDRSAAVLSQLPKTSCRAVALAQELFAELAKRIRTTPASELVRTRVRVPDPVKLRIAAGALAGRTPTSSIPTIDESHR
ncbi:MAG TPA: squalene/phytoene synthase family protein [Plantibacter sp.]|uniref:phytoene/squalene synthase family protein n=1 Tax=Plantibacter sp. TaxID=1871045 RepID=UPI002C823260|nr:squalene/phytoene synthase family protein [Plantibacter sp.]